MFFDNSLHKLQNANILGKMTVWGILQGLFMSLPRVRFVNISLIGDIWWRLFFCCLVKTCVYERIRLLWQRGLHFLSFSEMYGIASAILYMMCVVMTLYVMSSVYLIPVYIYTALIVITSAVVLSYWMECKPITSSAIKQEKDKSDWLIICK